MFKNPMHRILWWSALTLITVYSALRGLYLGQTDSLSIIGATMTSLALIYLIATYRIDGPEGMKRQETDERIRGLVHKSYGAGFLVLFICTWFLACLINVPGLHFLLQNINITLGSVAMIGLLAHWLSFVWYKYHV